MGRWSHRSLEWIHRVREENYEVTKDKPQEELLKGIVMNTEELIRMLNLRVVLLEEMLPPKRALRKK